MKDAREMKKEFIVYRDNSEKFYAQQNEAKDLTEVKIDVRRPNYTQQREAQFHYAKVFSNALANGVHAKIKIEQTLKDSGQWTEKDEKIELAMLNKIRECQKKLLAGKIKKSEAAKLAWENIERNNEYLTFTAKKNSYFNNCAENIAEQEKFNYLTYLCTVYNSNGERFWKNYDCFVRDNDENPVVVNTAGILLSYLMYNMAEDYRSDWPEYQFLKKFGFVNSNFEKLDKEGKVIEQEDVGEIVTVETAEYLDD